MTDQTTDDAHRVLDTVLSRDENGFTATFSQPADAAPCDAGDAPTTTYRTLPIHGDQDPTTEEKLATTAHAAQDVADELERTEQELEHTRAERNRLRNELAKACAELLHVGQVLTDWRNTFTDEPDILQDADRVLADLIDGGLLPTAQQPMPPVAAALGSPAARAQDLAAIADRIAQAIGDPGSIAGPRREEETITRWSTRAVLIVLGEQLATVALHAIVTVHADRNPASNPVNTPHSLRPADWEQKAIDAAETALTDAWIYLADDTVHAEQLATQAVRAIIDARLVGWGGHCPRCGSPYPRTLPAGADPRCTTCTGDSDQPDSAQDGCGTCWTCRAAQLDDPTAAVIRAALDWRAAIDHTTPGATPRVTLARAVDELLAAPACVDLSVPAGEEG